MTREIENNLHYKIGYTKGMIETLKMDLVYGLNRNLISPEWFEQVEDRLKELERVINYDTRNNSR